MLEKVDFLKLKEPSRGLNRIEKVGLEVGLLGEKEKLAEIIRGDSFGEPYWPMPDLRVRVRGGGGVVVEGLAGVEAGVVVVLLVVE